MKNLILMGLLTLSSSAALAEKWTCTLTDAYGRGYYDGTGPSKQIAKKRAYKACEDAKHFWESVAKCDPDYIYGIDCAQDDS